MKRSDKITRLVAVQFSEAELQRMPNHVLDATYDSARPLLEARREEVMAAEKIIHQRLEAKRKTLSRRQRHANERAEAKRRALELENRFLNHWTPIKPIAGAADKQREIEALQGFIKQASRRAEEDAERFRSTGKIEYARSSNAAREALIGFKQMLQEAIS